MDSESKSNEDKADPDPTKAISSLGDTILCGMLAPASLTFLVFGGALLGACKLVAGAAKIVATNSPKGRREAAAILASEEKRLLRIRKGRIKSMRMYLSQLLANGPDELVWKLFGTDRPSFEILSDRSIEILYKSVERSFESEMHFIVGMHNARMRHERIKDLRAYLAQLIADGRAGHAHELYGLSNPNLEHLPDISIDSIHNRVRGSFNGDDDFIAAMNIARRRMKERREMRKKE